jgi:hypothetical protein
MCHYRLPGMAAALAREADSLADRRPDVDDGISPAEEHLVSVGIRAKVPHAAILEGSQS